MKKLLSLLAVTTMVVSSGTLLVSCTSKLVRDDKLQYDLKTLKKVLFQITGENIDIDVNLGDYLSESEVNEIIQSTLNKTLGLQSAFDVTNSNLKQLGDDYAQYDIKDFNTKSYEQQANSIAQKKLFKEYTTALSNNESFDFQKMMDGFALNVIKDTNVLGFDGEQVEVKKESPQITFGEDRTIWATNAENIEAEKIGIPTIEMFTKEFVDKEAQFFVGDQGISAQTALSLRFQDYFENQLKSEITSNVMVMSHMNSKLFRYRDKNAFINPTNQFTNKLQDFNDASNNWETNVRMIWTLKFNKFKDEDKDKNGKLYDQILKSNEALKSNGSIVTEVNEIKGIIGLDQINTNDSSYDSYFGLSGYQGIKFNGFGEDPTSGKVWADQVNKWQDGAKIIYNTTSQPGFDVDNPNYNEIAIVLPIYFIELMAGSKSLDTPPVEESALDTNDREESETPNLDKLKAEIVTAKNIEQGNKTKEAFETLTAAIATAEGVTTEDEAEAALTTLKAAVEEFNESADATPNLDKLKAEILTAKDIKQGNKTDKAFETLTAAIATAEGIKTEDEAEAALTSLKAAVEEFNNSADATTPTNVYSIVDSKGNKKEIKLGRAGSSNEDILFKWRGFVNNKGSVDVRNTLAQDNNRNSLLNELLFMACTDTVFGDAAKREIYSKYLDKETIYYSGIWDMVKKYIDDEEDEDM